MELIGGKGIFADQVCKTPVAEGVQPVIVLQQIFHNIAGFKTGIADQITMGHGEVPFCHIHRLILNTQSLENLFYAADEKTEIICNFWETGGCGFIKEKIIPGCRKDNVSIIMDVHKVRHTIFFPAPAYKAVNPVFVSKIFNIEHGWAAELDIRADGFHSIIGVLEKTEKQGIIPETKR